jgi:hypothetical protein
MTRARSVPGEIKRGERTLDSISELVALADALQIALSELMRLRCRHRPQGHRRCGGGLALSRVRERSDDAVLAFAAPRRSRRITYTGTPFAREALAGLLARSQGDSPAGRELRRMAYRAGLPV